MHQVSIIFLKIFICVICNYIVACIFSCILTHKIEPSAEEDNITYNLYIIAN